MRRFYFFFFLLISATTFSQIHPFYKEIYRPQFHFTPPIHWMNDPNGLVYYKGEYHLFYQFNPFGNKWGHMSWGHAISKDLLYWQHLPVAIGEEKDTMIFSGSCVVDQQNSAGFESTTGHPAMVAIYTGHIEGLSQSQHIAFSTDEGRTWTKYNKNPVLDLKKKDFRDPSVFWYAPGNKWVMVVSLPIERQVSFYSSNNLKQWDWMSNFGPAGDTTGIWECPAIFPAPFNEEPGKMKWVLMLSPAPYMQYFVGEFDGQTFKNENPVSKIFRPDYGTDYYAAITYNNLPLTQQPVSIGWINNWKYANDIPTNPWRSAMSIPRQLSVKKINGEWILLQDPVQQFILLRQKLISWSTVNTSSSHILPVNSQTFEMEIMMKPAKGCNSGIRLAKGNGQYLEIGYDPEKKLIYIDRSKAGDNSFHPAFKMLNRFESPVRIINDNINLHIFYDKSIVEVFINNGEEVMTMQIFPEEKNSGIELFSNGNPVQFGKLRFWRMKGIW